MDEAPREPTWQVCGSLQALPFDLADNLVQEQLFSLAVGAAEQAGFQRPCSRSMS
jgi:hypothetical protein